MTSANDSSMAASPLSDIPPMSFAYQAQTAAGERLSGNLDARDMDDARNRLEQLGVRILEMQVVTPVKPRPLRGEDFAAFNQQLGQLASAGLPIEQGLRLIAQDMRTGRLARSVNMVADELEKGVPLGEAFNRHQKQFPPLYGELMDAGIKAGNLPAMLLNLGRSSELAQRLRGMLWRTASYPLMVLVGLVVVVLFLSRYVLPQFADLYRQFHIQIPVVTLTLLEVGNILPMLLVVIGIAIVAWWLLWRFVRRRDGGMGEATLISLPLVGPVVRRGRIARWCDAMKLSVDAGLDLPAAANLAADAIQSRGLRHDGLALIEWLHNAPDAHEPPADLRILPATVPASMGLALHDNQMSQVLGTLSQMYAQQAEQRMFIIPAVLGPILLVLVTIVLGLVLLALFLPMVSLIRAIGV